MYCPHCKDVWMEMYERFWDHDDGELLSGEEHYHCTRCDRTYSCDVSYTILTRGELEE